MVVRTGELKKQTKGFSTLARLYLESGQTTKAHEYYVNVSSGIPECLCHTAVACVYTLCEKHDTSSNGLLQTMNIVSG